MLQAKRQQRLGRNHNLLVAGKCGTSRARTGTGQSADQCAFTTAGQSANDRAQTRAAANESDRKSVV